MEKLPDMAPTIYGFYLMGNQRLVYILRLDDTQDT